MRIAIAATILCCLLFFYCDLLLFKRCIARNSLRRSQCKRKIMEHESASHRREAPPITPLHWCAVHVSDTQQRRADFFHFLVSAYLFLLWVFVCFFFVLWLNICCRCASKCNKIQKVFIIYYMLVIFFCITTLQWWLPL